jgi:hypothetical protein
LTAHAGLEAIAFGRRRHDPRRPDWANRDRIVLSKGRGPRALHRHGPRRVLPAVAGDHAPQARGVPGGDILTADDTTVQKLIRGVTDVVHRKRPEIQAASGSSRAISGRRRC